MNKKALECLQAHNIHPSVQRIAVMEYLLNHHTHPTVEDIYTELHPQIPTLSRTTVYNTLKLFASQGAATMLTIDEKRACYDSVLTPHAHFICRKCGHIYDVDLKDTGNQVHTSELPAGHVEEEHVYYKGICKHCLAKEAEDKISMN